MIELNRIRSMETLENLKKDLTDFINLDRATMLKIYEWDEFGEEDLDADLEKVNDLLEKINHRIKSLGNHLNKGIIKNELPQSDEAVSSSSVPCGS
jgi:hypothetical protein